MPVDLPLDPSPDDVVSVLEEHIEQRLGRPISALRDEAATAKTPDPATVRVVREYTELAAAEKALEAREDELFALIVASPGVFTDEHMAAAQAVNNALTYRDARVATVVHSVLLHPLDPQAPARTAQAAAKARPHQATSTRSTSTSPTTPAAAAPTGSSSRRR
ncbi:hypothetical protein ACFY0R_09990 [Streptomyces sp. NPDC001633]|uniref:hypothetical protein n=1 Tax=Streptomyces sp. NPDC001633 TaxID=3364595 RepID=UPI0036CF205E